MHSKAQFALGVTILVFWSLQAAALSGDVDTQFGNDGKVITDFFDRTDVGNNLIIDKAGKLLLAGSATKSTISDHFALARYNENGTLDESFGQGGRVTTRAIGDNNFVHGGIMGMGFLSTGTIIACGRASINGAPGFGLVAYDDNGSLDLTFKNNGATLFADDGEEIHPLALTVDERDNIIMVASSFLPSGESATFAVYRFHADGNLDESFGLSGKVVTRITSGINVPRAVQIDAQGRILVGGFSGNNKFVVVRYLPHGQRDSAFGAQGIATINFNSGGIDTLHTLKIQQDGKILVGGDVQVGSFAGLRMVDFGLARLTSDGILDLSFNKTGKVITEFIRPAASSLWALTLQSDGKIIAVGDAASVGGLAVARYRDDGSLDEDFGDGGKQVVAFGKTCHWEAVVLQADQKIIAGGYVWNGKHYDMALVRFQNEPSLN